MMTRKPSDTTRVNIISWSYFIKRDKTSFILHKVTYFKANKDCIVTLRVIYLYSNNHNPKQILIQCSKTSYLYMMVVFI